jgi:hypothetical protein
MFSSSGELLVDRDVISDQQFRQVLQTLNPRLTRTDVTQSLAEEIVQETWPPSFAPSAHSSNAHRSINECYPKRVEADEDVHLVVGVSG